MQSRRMAPVILDDVHPECRCQTLPFLAICIGLPHHCGARHPFALGNVADRFPHDRLNSNAGPATIDFDAVYAKWTVNRHLPVRSDRPITKRLRSWVKWRDSYHPI